MKPLLCILSYKKIRRKGGGESNVSTNPEDWLGVYLKVLCLRVKTEVIERIFLEQTFDVLALSEGLEYT